MGNQRINFLRSAVVISVLNLVFSLPNLVERELSYEGFKVLRLQSTDHNKLGTLLKEIQQNEKVDVWSQSHGSADVMVGPEHLRQVQDTAENQGIDTSVVIDDVQRYLEKDYEERHHNRRRRATRDVTNSYLTYEEINGYLQTVSRGATASSVTLKSIGSSYEGRNVPAIELREKTYPRQEKRVILIDAGIHAREWMAVAMALNVVHKLAYNPDNDPEVNELLKKFDWIVVPVVNPDGYVYSHSGANQRLWRKTRTRQYSWYCPGVDGNRNFGYDWNPEIGGSRQPCEDTYAGPHAFSEKETQNIRDWLQEYQDNAAAYITVHAFGEWMLYPYGSNKNKFLDDKELIESVGNAFKAKLGETGHSYTVGNSADLLYPAAGGSDDYAKGALKIPVSYTLEMSPKSQYGGGFTLSESHVYQVAQDTWPGFKKMAQLLYDKLNNQNNDSNDTGGSTTTNDSSNNSNVNGLVAIPWFGTTIYVNPTQHKAIYEYLQYMYRMRSGGKM